MECGGAWFGVVWCDLMRYDTGPVRYCAIGRGSDATLLRSDEFGHDPMRSDAM